MKKTYEVLAKYGLGIQKKTYSSGLEDTIKEEFEMALGDSNWTYPNDENLMLKTMIENLMVWRIPYRVDFVVENSELFQKTFFGKGKYPKFLTKEMGIDIASLEGVCVRFNDPRETIDKMIETAEKGKLGYLLEDKEEYRQMEQEIQLAQTFSDVEDEEVAEKHIKKIAKKLKKESEKGKSVLEKFYGEFLASIKEDVESIYYEKKGEKV